jgi:glycosyltransferase involved in cell wall biosynthesis
MSAIVMAEALLHRLLGSYSRHVNRMVVPSKFYLEKFCEWGMPRSLFRHVPNFVNADGYEPQFAPGSAILYFGRISPEKGLATLIRAAAMAKCRLMIAGTGSALAEMRQLANKIGADVAFLGHLSGTRLHEAVRTARAVVMPSEWYENAPISILEAYALGKPVAGARIGGIPELIRENETGLGFPSGDADALAVTLRALMDLPDRDIEAMGRSGRAWVEEEFRRELYRERILEVYAEIGVQNT